MESTTTKDNRAGELQQQLRKLLKKIHKEADIDESELEANVIIAEATKLLGKRKPQEVCQKQSE